MTEFTKVICEVGEIANAAFTVTVEVSVAPKASVTFTTAEPEAAGAV